MGPLGLGMSEGLGKGLSWGGGESQEDETARQSLMGVVEEGNWKTSPAEQALEWSLPQHRCPHQGLMGSLPARLLPDCLNLCSLVLQPSALLPLSQGQGS